MSRPGKKQSHDGATATGPGEAHFSRAHTALGIFVVASNFDSANDALTVQLEGGFEGKSPTGTDGTDYLAPIYDGSTQLSIDGSALVDSGDGSTYYGFLWASNVPAEKVRANISSITDNAGGDLSVDTYVLLSNNASGGGHSFEPDSA
jgi:hypothetical protein